MRQGQQNRRGRGRNNNRKSQNPLMRSFESTGPDVKIRGTPSHIAEKYVSLARDALASGDPVLAENYLQHAEHYNRIILTYREQQMAQGGIDPYNSGAARTHTLAGPDGNDGDEFGEDEGEDFAAQPQPAAGGEAPQQPFQSQPRNFDNPNRFDNRPQRHDNRQDQHRFNRHDRGDNPRFDRGDRHDRGERQDFRGDRQDRNGSGGGEHRYRDDRRQFGNGGEGQSGDGGFRRRERYQGANGADRDAGGLQAPGAVPPQPAAAPERPVAPPQAASQPPVEQQEQPAFLRRPVRRPRREESEEPAPVVSDDKE